MPIPPSINWSTTDPVFQTFINEQATIPQTLTAFLDELNVPKKQEKKTVEKSNQQFQNLIGYPSLKTNITKCKQFESAYVLDTQYKFCVDNALVGIEIEVENITENPNTVCYWTNKADGSLRNNGVEFVSQPLTPHQIPYALSHLTKCIRQQNNPDFSNRTSVHIHLNCRDMTQDEVWNLVILYCIFEKHFYKFAGTRRLNSIFCVPVYKSNILQNLDNVIYDLSDQWSKYCGINLLPLVHNSVTGVYGTIEFRHLYGTDNPFVLMEWINTILSLRKLAQEIKKDELIEMLKEMNTTSSYKSLYYRFLGDMKPLLSENKDFEECISNVKRELFGKSFEKTLRISATSPYWTLCHELRITG